MKLNVSFNDVFKNTILTSKTIGKNYKHTYPNSKYTLNDIINELIYVLKTGLSWRMLRSDINSKTLYWHFQRFIDANIFERLFKHLRNLFIKNNSTDIQIIDAKNVALPHFVA